MQNINLLSALPKEIKPYLSAQVLVAIFLGFLLLLILLATVMWSIVTLQEQRVNSLIASKQDLTQKIMALKSDKIKQEQRVKDQQKLFANNKEMKVFLASKNGQGFAKYLTVLAALTPENVWLKTMVFSNQDHYIALFGNTTNAALISELLQKLNNTSIFSTNRFRTLELNKTKANDGKTVISFEITTAAVKADSDTGKSKT
ncbi:MAG: PilN domain-containing protein [Gammaproteobacteria bacterium]|nr:PilN domain-containing protein [Gammaproteobacteria bacterium]